MKCNILITHSRTLKYIKLCCNTTHTIHTTITLIFLSNVTLTVSYYYYLTRLPNMYRLNCFFFYIFASISVFFSLFILIFSSYYLVFILYGTTLYLLDLEGGVGNCATAYTFIYLFISLIVIKKDAKASPTSFQLFFSSATSNNHCSACLNLLATSFWSNIGGAVHLQAPIAWIHLHVFFYMKYC